MKNSILLIFCLLTLTISESYAAKFKFKLKNQEGEHIEVYSEIYKNNVLIRRDFLIEVSTEELVEVSIKSNETVTFTGSSITSKKELVKREYSFRSLNDKQERTVDLRLLFPEEISGKILKFPELLIKLQNDRLCKLLTDTLKYKTDRFPDLGAFILHNTETQESSYYNLGLNLDKTESFNIVTIEDKNWVRSDLNIAIGGNITAFNEIKMKMGTEQIIEFHTVISNFKQKKLTGTSLNPYKYLQEAEFYDFLKQKFSSKNASVYKLFFISSYFEADSIKFMGRSLQKLEVGSHVGVKQEAVVDVSLDLKYLRDKGFYLLDNRKDVKFDYLVIDVTAFMAFKANNASKSFIIEENKTQLKKIEKTIQTFYNSLIKIDTQLHGYSVFPEGDDIMTITDAVSDEKLLEVKTNKLDSTGSNVINNLEIINYNRLVSTYNKNLSNINKRLKEYQNKEEEILKLEQASNGLILEDDFMTNSASELDDNILENIKIGIR